MEEGSSSGACRCPCQRSRSHSGLSLGYIRTRFPWKPLLSTTWTYLVLLLVILNCCTAAAAVKPSIPTLQPAGIHTFRYYDEEHGQYAKYYRYLNLEGNYLYIGAMNYVLRVTLADISSTNDFQKTKRLNESSMFDVHQQQCRSTHVSTVDYDCQNHIRSIIPRGDGKLEVCGTSAYTPSLFVIDPWNFDEKVDELYAQSTRGRAICPPNPEDSCTVLYVRDGNPGGKTCTYSGTMMDFTKDDPIIYRPMLSGDSKLLRTEKSDTKWLNEPVFVQSFDVGDYVYFFFRESAIEYMNCGKAIYSRVARVCKKDRGGARVLESRFTTYFKARLNCSIPGDYPFYFNELHDVFRIGNGDVFHGLFRTNNIGLTGSAICTFGNDDIQKAFDGAFKEQTESTSSWQRVPDKRVPDPRPGSCSDDSRTVSDNVLQFTKAHPLMDESVSTQIGQPTFIKQEVNYTKITVEQVDQYTLYYLATDKGEVDKVVSWNGGSKTITTWTDITANNLPIQQMKLHNHYLYISTDEEVVQLDVRQCNQYNYCTQCVQDPHCGWDNRNNICSLYRPEFLRNVTADLPEKTCNSECHVTTHQHTVKVHGDPVHLHCKSHCEPSNNIQWHRNNAHESILIDEKKYFQTMENSLIIFNVTEVDVATYRCKSEQIIMAEHNLRVGDCDSPESCWKHEFTRWCKEFDTYQQEIEEWQCLRDQCVGDNQCIPKLHVDECRKPTG